MDVAFTPQINEFRGSRTVQLNVVDLRLSRRLRAEAESERALYLRFRRNETLAPEEAAKLLPSRGAFVAVWRYLVSHSQASGIQENLLCMGRKLSRACAGEITLSKTKICLDVFAEQGLIELQSGPKFDTIRLTTDGRKVDLDESTIVKRLRADKQSETH